MKDVNALSAHILQKKFFLWDFDGCFGDTEQLHFEAFSAAFREYGHSVNPHEYFETFTHLGLGAKGEIERHKLSCSAEDIARLKKENYWKLISRGTTKVFSEMSDIVKALKRQGAKVAIASNSPAVEIEEILKANPLVPKLDLIVGLTDGLRKKPHPDIFLHAMKLLGATPQETLVFEDSDRGLAAAQAAGCEAIWIRTSLNARFDTSRPTLARLTHAELLGLLR